MFPVESRQGPERYADNPAKQFKGAGQAADGGSQPAERGGGGGHDTDVAQEDEGLADGVLHPVPGCHRAFGLGTCSVHLFQTSGEIGQQVFGQDLA